MRSWNVWLWNWSPIICVLSFYAAKLKDETKILFSLSSLIFLWDWRNNVLDFQRQTLIGNWWHFWFVNGNEMNHLRRKQKKFNFVWNGYFNTSNFNLFYPVSYTAIVNLAYKCYHFTLTNQICCFKWHVLLLLNTR